MMKKKSYHELSKLESFEDRYNYLKLDGFVGFDTFGHDRYMNQMFYKSKEWKAIRNYVMFRDKCCDLGIQNKPIYGKVYIHHINPITKNDILHSADNLLDPDNLICVSFETHNAIHYGSFESIPNNEIKERKPNDTCPWKNGG